jgi:hypothetical protein
MWRPSVAQFLKCFSHSFTRNKRKSKSPTDVLAKHKAQIPAKEGSKDRPELRSQKMKKELEVTNRVEKEELKLITKPSFKRTCQNSSGRKVKYNFGKNKNNYENCFNYRKYWINRFSIIRNLLESADYDKVIAFVKRYGKNTRQINTTYYRFRQA